MTKKERTRLILQILDEHYKFDDKCHLDYTTPFELLVATILSAQCTDKRVNIVTKDLFKEFPTVQDYAFCDLSNLERAIKTTGFYHNKAKNIKAMSYRLLTEFNGEVPKDLDDLLTLEGVGRKTANVIRGNIYKEPSIVVDTHVKRISKRFGLTKEADPVKIEFDLMKTLPRDAWIRYNHQVIAHGRAICIARRAKCEECMFIGVCKQDMSLAHTL